jgi:hypothetical protein
LRQVVVNLVGNAIKFTERGEIVVGVDEVSRTDDAVELHFHVKDTGIGIPADKIDAIFRPFEQADVSTTRKFGGTGLGLAICVQLVELMGGRVWAESVEGAGSTIHFTTRCGIGERSRELDDDARQVVLESMPVLVVDDNATIDLKGKMVLPAHRARLQQHQAEPGAQLLPRLTGRLDRLPQQRHHAPGQPVGRPVFPTDASSLGSRERVR